MLAFISSRNHLNLLCPHFHILCNLIKNESFFFLIFYCKKHMLLFWNRLQGYNNCHGFMICKIFTSIVQPYNLFYNPSLSYAQIIFFPFFAYLPQNNLFCFLVLCTSVLCTSVIMILVPKYFLAFKVDNRIINPERRDWFFLIPNAFTFNPRCSTCVSYLSILHTFSTFCIFFQLSAHNLNIFHNLSTFCAIYQHVAQIINILHTYTGHFCTLY